MTNKEEYSFNSEITEVGCIYIPEEILENLDLKNEFNIRIIPSMEKHRLITLETDSFDINFNILHNKNLIHKKFKETIAIEEDYLFLLNFYSPRNLHGYLEMPQLAGVLLKLFGEPDSFYDHIKDHLIILLILELFIKTKLQKGKSNLQ